MSRVDVRRRIALALVAVVTLLYYVFVATAGTFERVDFYTSFFDSLAEGLRDGHLYMADEPPPQLLQAVDPFDPSNRPFWYWDASFFGGRYYMYWGPVPGLGLAAIKSLFGMRHAVGDASIALGFGCGRLLVGLLLIELLARRAFYHVPVWLVTLAAIAYALSSPTPFILARGAVYEVAILAGQFFLVGGLNFAVRAMVTRVRSPGLLMLASLSWALALGSRISLLPCVGLVCFTMLVVLALRARPVSLAEIMALGVPLVLAGLLLGLYNYARFGSVTEFGVTYQLTWMHFTMDLGHAAANVYSHLLRPIDFSCSFPFVRAPWDLGAQSLPAWLPKLPSYHVGEPVPGFVWSCPWLFLGALALFVVGWRRRSLDLPRGFGFWLVLVLVFLATFPLAPTLGLWMATVRYQMDVASGATLLAGVGTFSLWEGLAERSRWLRVVTALPIAAVGGYSIGVGGLLGFQGYHDHFQANNPALVAELGKRWSLCDSGAIRSKR